MPSSWKFYGRTGEMEAIRAPIEAPRFRFVKITGRRRIGKTTLIQRALSGGGRPVFYVSIPDSTPAGVLDKVRTHVDEFGLEAFGAPDSLAELARLVRELVRAGFVVALDEFQVFLRSSLNEFCSHLQVEVDRMRGDEESFPGTLVVLGSIATEVSALLDDRSAPLFGRTSDEIRVEHLDVLTIRQLLADHAVAGPNELLFYWSLFEGVPKFYRDCFDGAVFGRSRRGVVEKLFFEEGSPLRTEAENWFLKELKGRYDAIFSFLARQPGSTNGQIESGLEDANERRQVAGYLQQLRERYGMVERRLPILAKPRSRKGRYYINDNFLSAWISALQRGVELRNFRPREDLLRRVDERLAECEGWALEKMVRRLLEARSRLGMPGFNMTAATTGWWDRGDIEIDSVVLDEDAGSITFSTVKRNPEKALADLPNLHRHAERFLSANRLPMNFDRRFRAISTSFDDAQRRIAVERDAQALGLEDLLDGL